MQSNLYNWIKVININKNQKNFDSIFYLKWSKNKKRPYKNIQADFISKLPDKYNFYNKIKWENKYIFLVGLFHNENKYIYPEFEIIHEGLLKSHLQKCVRRKLIYKAVQSAYNLMAINFKSFIRRLPIIMLEDTILHESFPTIIWMMLAYPKWQPTVSHIRWLLSIVYLIASCKKYDKIITESIIKECESHQNIINSLKIRKSFSRLK